MSLGNSRACFIAFATYPAFPFWKSLIDEFPRREDPSSTKGGVPVWNPDANISSFISQRPMAQGLCLASLCDLGPFLRLHLLGKATSALFHYLLPFLLSFSFFISNLQLRVIRSGKRGELSLSVCLGRLSPNLGLHHLHKAGPGFALYPYILLYLTHLGRRGVAEILNRNYEGLKAAEDFEIVFRFKDLNYLFFLHVGRL